jgi:hypothetical protein
MPKKGYNHSGRKVWRGTLKNTVPRPRYKKAVKKRFHVSAVARNDGNLGPHQMVMGQRYTIVISGTNADKVLNDLTSAGFIVEDVMSTGEYQRAVRTAKHSDFIDAAESRSIWAVRAKHDQSKARHRLRIRQSWVVNFPAALDTLSQYGQEIAGVAERVMSSLSGLLDQRRLVGAETIDAPT